MSLHERIAAAHGTMSFSTSTVDGLGTRAQQMAADSQIRPGYGSIDSSSSSCTSSESDADSLPLSQQNALSLIIPSDFLQPGGVASSVPQAVPDGGLAISSISAAFGAATAASRAGSSLSSQVSGASESGAFTLSDVASLPPSGRPSPRQMLPQPPTCRPPVALPAPSGQGAMLVDASSGRLEWVQPSGPRKAGEGTEPEQQGIISFAMLPQGGALMSITLLASGFVIGPSGCSVRELARATGADIKSWSDSFVASVGVSRPARTFLLQGPPASVLAAAEVAAAAVVRYKYLCEGSCFGQQVSRLQVVRGITFVYLPPPRRKVPYAAAIASAPLPRSMSSAYNPAPQLTKPQTRLNASAAAWPPSLQQPAMRQPQPTLQQQPQSILQRQRPAAVPPLRLQPLPGNASSIWSSSAVNGATAWPAAASGLLR